MGAGASSASDSNSSNEIHRTWSFLDQDGLHVIEMVHDVFTGGRKIYHNQNMVVLVPYVLIDTGSAHSFAVKQHQLICRVLEDGLGFEYELKIDGVDIAEHNRKLRKHLSVWYFNIDQKLHTCIMLHDGRFVLMLDGVPIETESEFVENGSRHLLYLSDRKISMDVFATGEDESDDDEDAPPPILYPIQAVPDPNGPASAISSSSFGSNDVLYQHPAASTGKVNVMSLARKVKKPKYRYQLKVDEAVVEPEPASVFGSEAAPSTHLALGKPIRRGAFKNVPPPAF